MIESQLASTLVLRICNGNEEHGTGNDIGVNTSQCLRPFRVAVELFHGNRNGDYSVCAKLSSYVDDIEN